MYGLPAGAFIDWAYGELADEPFIKDPEQKLLFTRGLTDWVSNKVVAPSLDDDGTRSDVLIGKGLSPYSEHIVPPITFFIELSKLIDGNPHTNPRFPALGLGSSMVKTAKEMKGWTIRKDMGPTEKITKIVGEAFETASGYNNWVKGNLMFASRNIVSKRGNVLGDRMSVFDGLYKMGFGGENQKQLEHWEAVSTLMEHKAHIKETAKDTYAILVNMRTKLGTEEYGDKISQMSSMFTVLREGDRFTEQDLVDLFDEVWKLDSMSQKSGKGSLFQAMWEQNYNDLNDKFKKILKIMQGSRHPKTIEFLKAWEERDKIL